MKNLSLGILIGFFLSFATTSFAAVGDKVQAVFAQFNYVVNGESKTLDSPVLVYDGNSYLRTTQVSNLLGYDVTYKADNRTIEFNGSLPAAEPSPVVVVEQSGETPTEQPGASLGQSPEPSSEPSPDTKLEQCQAIRDNYNGQIAMVGYSGLSQGQMALKKLQLEHARDDALASAGC